MTMTAAITKDSLSYYLTTGSVAARPTAWTVSLHSAAPGSAGTANELSYSGYVRKSASFAVNDTVPASTFAANSADIVFAAPAASVTVTHVVVWAGTTPLVIQALREPKTLSASVDAVLATGDLIIGGIN